MRNTFNWSIWKKWKHPLTGWGVWVSGATCCWIHCFLSFPEEFVRYMCHTCHVPFQSGLGFSLSEWHTPRRFDTLRGPRLLRFLTFAPVWKALWHQRMRLTEGGGVGEWALPPPPCHSDTMCAHGNFTVTCMDPSHLTIHLLSLLLKATPDWNRWKVGKK